MVTSELSIVDLLLNVEDWLKSGGASALKMIIYSYSKPLLLPRQQYIPSITYGRSDIFSVESWQPQRFAAAGCRHFNWRQSWINVLVIYEN